jgi:hypothetical protein
MTFKLNISPFIEAVLCSYSDLKQELPTLIDDWSKTADGKNEHIIMCVVQLETKPITAEVHIELEDSRMLVASGIKDFPTKSLATFIFMNCSRKDLGIGLLKMYESIWSVEPRLFHNVGISSSIMDDKIFKGMQEKLDKKCLSKMCPLCQKTTLKLQDGISRYQIYEKTMFTTVVVLCTNCGWISEHDIRSLSDGG